MDFKAYSPLLEMFFRTQSDRDLSYAVAGLYRDGKGYKITLEWSDSSYREAARALVENHGEPFEISCCNVEKVVDDLV